MNSVRPMLENTNDRPLARLANALFYIWIFSLPFGGHFTRIFSIPGLDKILIPFLYLLLLFPVKSYDKKTRFGLFVYICFVFLFIIAQNISFINSSSLLFTSAYHSFVNISCYILPLLYVNNFHSLRKSTSVLVILTVVGSVSVILVSLGVITMPVERFEASRLGIEFIPKSIGVFARYGDYALVYVLTIISTVWIAEKNVPLVPSGKLAKTIIFVCLFAGLVGAQSRNVLLTAMVGTFVMYRLVRAKDDRGKKIAFRIGVLSCLLVGGAVLALILPTIISDIMSLGGKLAERTAEGRLAQYRFAFGIFWNSPFLGTDTATYLKYGKAIDGVHNMWLEMAARGGIFQIFVMLFWLIRILSMLFGKLRRSPGIMEYKLLLSIVVCACFSTLFYGGQTQIFWVLLGIASGATCFTAEEDERAASDLNPS